jgi:thioesterase domain-containing protein
VIALAIADELERHDQSVAFLGILDVPPPVDAYAAGHHDSIQELATYITAIDTSFQCPGIDPSRVMR